MYLIMLELKNVPLNLESAIYIYLADDFGSPLIRDGKAKLSFGKKFP